MRSNIFALIVLFLSFADKSTMYAESIDTAQLCLPLTTRIESLYKAKQDSLVVENSTFREAYENHSKQIANLVNDTNKLQSQLKQVNNEKDSLKIVVSNIQNQKIKVEIMLKEQENIVKALKADSASLQFKLQLTNNLNGEQRATIQKFVDEKDALSDSLRRMVRITALKEKQRLHTIETINTLTIKLEEENKITKSKSDSLNYLKDQLDSNVSTLILTKVNLLSTIDSLNLSIANLKGKNQIFVKIALFAIIIGIIVLIPIIFRAFRLSPKEQRELNMVTDHLHICILKSYSFNQQLSTILRPAFFSSLVSAAGYSLVILYIIANDSNTFVASLSQPEFWQTIGILFIPITLLGTSYFGIEGRKIELMEQLREIRKAGLEQNNANQPQQLSRISHIISNDPFVPELS